MRNRTSTLALALALVIAGCGDDGDDGMTTATSADSIESAPDPTGASTSAQGTESGDTADGATSDDAGTSGSTSTGSSGQATNSWTSGVTTGASPPPVCGSYCAAQLECDPMHHADVDACAQECGDRFDFFEPAGPLCESDFTALLTCLSGLACPELATYWQLHGQPNAPDYPCRVEDIEVLASCQAGLAP